MGVVVTETEYEANGAFHQYCEAIFELAEDDVEVIQARVAERLGVSRPAVSEMMKRLDADGFIELRGNVIQLTERGSTFAELVVRRHRLAERMLTDILGLSWAEAHAEAGRWENVISPAVERAINRILGDPTTCPHGNPIPGSDYRPPETVLLATIRPGDRFQVSRIPEELEFTPGLLQYLEDASVTPGRHGSVTACSPDGTVTVCIDDQHIGIGQYAASRIMVAVLERSGASR